MDPSVAGSELFELLPVPCIYLLIDGQIERINAAARRVIVTQHNSLLGSSIFNTNFAADYLDDPSSLKEALQHLIKSSQQTRPQSGEAKQRSNGHSDDFAEGRAGEQVARGQKRGRDEDPIYQDSIPLRSSRSCRLQWQLTILRMSGVLCFSLTGNHKSSWRDSYMPKDEEFDFLLELAGPTFKNVPYYVNVMHADTQTLKVNKAATQHQPRLADAFSRRLPLGMWDDAFTKPLTLSGGIGPMSLREKRGKVAALRGIQDPVTGMRTIHDCTATVLQNPYTDEPLGVVVQIRDPQEYTDWLQQLDVSDSREAAMADGRLPIMVRTMLNDGQLDYFSNSWEAFTKSSRKELLGTWTSWFHEEDLDIIKRQIVSSMATGVSCEYQIRLRNGDYWHYFRERFAPVKQDGKIIRWYFISTDIKDLVTERDAALQVTDRLYRIINSMNIIIFEVDDSWKVTQAEGALKVRTADGQEMTAANYPGNSLYDICSVIRPDGIKELMDELIKVMDGQQGKVIVDYKLGEQWLRTIAIPGVDRKLGAGKRLFGITLDTSAEHDSENAKLQLESMQETDRLKSQFLANISHELRTPISGLIGILELLKATKLDHIQEDFVSTLESSSQSLLVIVNDVLDLSKAEAGHISINKIAFSLDEVLNDICRSNKVLAVQKGLEFSHTQSKLPKALVGDLGRIRQILQNLLGNAIKFTSSGSITIQTKCMMEGGIAKLQIDILDTGIGIDSETMAILFRPFVQADQSDTRVYGGTGLGLSIARKFAQLMDGNVVLESEKGRGTRAIIYLNLAVLEADVPTLERDVTPIPTVTSEISMANKDRHVLVVEDNKINEKVIRFQLQKMGFGHVSSATNGAEAIDLVKSFIENGEKSDVSIPDLILMDCQMPVLDGYKATQVLRNEVGFSRPIVALTASAIQGDREKCLAAGMDDHIAKPASQKALQQIFKKWLAK